MQKRFHFKSCAEVNLFFIQVVVLLLGAKVLRKPHIAPDCGSFWEVLVESNFSCPEKTRPGQLSFRQSSRTIGQTNFNTFALSQVRKECWNGSFLAVSLPSIMDLIEYSRWHVLFVVSFSVSRKDFSSLIQILVTCNDAVFLAEVATNGVCRCEVLLPKIFKQRVNLECLIFYSCVRDEKICLDLNA